MVLPSQGWGLQWLSRLPADWLKAHCTSIRKCKEAHAVLLRAALFQHSHSVSKLFSFLTSLPDSAALAYARRLFSQLARPDSFICNALIRGHARHPHDPSLAVAFYRVMAASGPAPDHHTYPFVFMASARLPDPRLGEAFHGVVMKVGLEADVFVLNSLVQMYSDFGRLPDALRLFDASPQRDVVSWNVMIKALVRGGDCELAFRFFDKMLGRDGIEPDVVTLISLASSCAQLGDLDKGRLVHSRAKFLGLIGKNVRLGNAIIDMYCKGGDMESAWSVFHEMPDVDVTTYTCMISGLTASGCFQASLDLFRQMQEESILPDAVALVAVLSACAQMGALDQGKYVHHLIERHIVKCDVVLETALVDMYAKCCSIALALQVFFKMGQRNVYTWNAMIGGLAMHGHGQRALDVFEEMKREKVVPDEVTFIGILAGCSHAGLVSNGLDLFSMMKHVYLIQPRMEHYGCVVDLLCRAKRVHDALDFIESMPIKPNVVLWASLLGACRSVGNMELAERIGSRVLELEPDSCDRYVMLFNMYAGVRQWEDAMEVRDQMNIKGIQKIPGISWIEVNGVAHQFIAGDKSHVEADKIYMMVEEMRMRVKSAGRISATSDVLFDIEEEEREHSVLLHSEKLALAFGLLSSAPGSPIRIVKNLRVCSDCHSFLKSISKIFVREIVARDRSRFHHFRGGSCSCMDYW